MKWTDDTTSGVSAARLAGWRPAWELLSAGAALTGALCLGWILKDDSNPLGWTVAGSMGVLALKRTIDAWQVYKARFPLGGMALDLMDFSALAAIMRGMKGKAIIGLARDCRRERFEAGRRAIAGERVFDAS